MGNLWHPFPPFFFSFQSTRGVNNAKHGRMVGGRRLGGTNPVCLSTPSHFSQMQSPYSPE